eukprot:gene4541-6411_t
MRYMCILLFLAILRGCSSSANQGDDFLAASYTNLSTPCSSESQIYYHTQLLTFFALLSTLCYMYLLWMFFVVKSPVLKRHPTTWAIYKCIFEFLFVQQYLWLPWIPTSKFYSIFYEDDQIGPNFYCKSTPSVVAPLSFLSQFSLVASILSFLVISIDLRSAYMNPFSSYDQKKTYFAAFVIGVSLATAFALFGMGPRVYGVSVNGSIWIQDQRAGSHFNYPKLVLFYLFTVSTYIYCLWSAFVFSRYSSKGFGRTLSNRIPIMNRSRKYLLGYVFFGCSLMTLEFVGFLNSFVGGNNGSPSNSTPSTAPTTSPIDQSIMQTVHPEIFSSLEGYYYSLQGVWSLAVIMYSNWLELTVENINPFQFQRTSLNDGTLDKVAMEGLLLQPHLNTALRAEILIFTTQGIIHAAKDYEVRSGHAAVHISASANNESSREDSVTYSFGENGSLPSLNHDSNSVSIPPRNNNGSIHEPSIVNPIRSEPIPIPTESILAVKSRQEEIVTADKEIALAEEYEKLGTPRNSFISIGLPPSGSHIAVSVNTATSDNNILHPRMTSLNSSRSTLVNNPIHPPPGSSFISNQIHNHIVPEYEMRNSTGNRNSITAPIQMRDSDVSGSSDSTARWRSTADIEYSIRQSLDKANDSSNWLRKNIPSNRTKAATISADSTNSSAMSIITESLISRFNRTFNTFKSILSAQVYQEFKFKDYLPRLFAKVRELCNVTPEDYTNAFKTTCKEKFSEGRSGAFMFYSSDQKFIVKTTTKAEIMVLHRIMPSYVDHLLANPGSLLVRFLGAHCITMYGQPLYFFVMKNLFPNIPLSERYDLKGSWCNRHGYKGSRRTRLERQQRELTYNPPLYLDNDLLTRISLQKDVVNTFADQIRRDTAFLKEMQVMDYSLLVGVKREKFEVIDSGDRMSQSLNGLSSIRNTTTDVSSRPLSLNLASTQANVNNHDSLHRDAHGGMQVRIVEGPGVYYLGMIDILQEWNFFKRCERFFKVYFRMDDPDGISAMDPISYADRFWKRVMLDTFEGIEVNDDYFIIKKRTANQFSRESIVANNSSTFGTSLNDGNSLPNNDSQNSFSEGLTLSSNELRKGSSANNTISSNPSHAISTQTILGVEEDVKRFVKPLNARI